MSNRTGFEKTLAVLVGFTALAASLLATLELDAGRKGDRASLLGARLPVQIFQGIAASQLRSDFHLNTEREASATGLQGLARLLSSFREHGALDFEDPLGRSQFTASKRLRAAALEMAAISPRSRGVDPATAAAILATPKQLAAQVRVQGRVIDSANAYSTRDGKAVFALSLVAIAAALLGLAAVFKGGPGGHIALGAGAVALALSTIWGLLALA